MRVQESRENYLEAILMLQKKLGLCPLRGCGQSLNFSRPSVSVAMANLRSLGLVTTDEHGFLGLTPEGLAEAEKVLERHLLITDWLVGLGVGAETAAEDACRMEHVISPASFQKLTELYQKSHPSTEPTENGRRFDAKTDPAD